ncbi:hypothetical protein BV22DRAFT_1029294 [Leucogyrophana mollusca]|uniref:Uncharacterized protein n=1 Tax=Leucogyrophana mollusca TaxID=85980 RepID=A0ACB8BYC6_9AGAM|nr:hypothetical protein BV22DRAFT_1029294 [Leucogyrophana mollusca]
MPTWTTISFDNPGNEHPMLTKVLQVLQVVYRNLDPDNEPKVIDDVKYRPVLSFQVRQGTSELSIAKIYARERLSGASQVVTHFAIDLFTRQIYDGVEDCHYDAPEEITPVLGELLEYLEGEGRKRKQFEDNRKREEAMAAQKKAEERKQQVQAFFARLLEHGLMNASDIEKYRHSDVCPFCAFSLVQCNSCGVVSCQRSMCDGSKFASVVRCLSHPEEQYCRKCLDEQALYAPLGQCPECHLWLCWDDLNWCCGRPQDIPGVEETDSARATRSERYLVRQHPPRPGPCSECVDGGIAAWPRCGNKFCWSRQKFLRHKYGAVICPDCCLNGLRCVCMRSWTCDDCSSAPFGAPLDRCPRCRSAYCHLYCKYSDHCVTCQKPTLCNDCQEEDTDADMLNEDGQLLTEGVELVASCVDCRGKFCNSCNANVNAKCERCQGVLCNRCAGFDVCGSCRAPLSEQWRRAWGMHQPSDGSV